jgi:sugar O-acyltransferase (sialic acid O-acetyltransferase NeuD family)
MERIAIVGSSGHARMVLDVLAAGEAKCCGFIDSFKPAGSVVKGYTVLGDERAIPELRARHGIDSLIIAIGDNYSREQMAQSIRETLPGARFATLIRPSCQLGSDVRIGEGCVLMPGSIVNQGSRVGEFCILNTRSSLDHDCEMKDFSSIAPGVITGGNVQIGVGSCVCIGAVTIGDYTVVGAGSLLLNNLPDCVVAYGVPARIIRRRAPGDPYLKPCATH